MTKNLEAVRDQIEDQTTDLDQIDADMEPERIEGETRAEAFRRLANKRLPVAVKRIRLMGNLSSANYEYTDEQAELIIATLEKEVAKLTDLFFKGKVEDDIPTL